MGLGSEGVKCGPKDGKGSKPKVTTQALSLVLLTAGSVCRLFALCTVLALESSRASLKLDLTSSQHNA